MIFSHFYQFGKKAVTKMAAGWFKVVKMDIFALDN